MEIPWLCFWPVWLNNWAVIYKLWQISKNRYCSLNTQNNKKETSFKRIQIRAFPGEGFTGGLWSAVWDLPNPQILIDLGISCTTFHNRCFWRKKNKYSKFTRVGFSFLLLAETIISFFLTKISAFSPSLTLSFSVLFHNNSFWAITSCKIVSIAYKTEGR